MKHLSPLLFLLLFSAATAQAQTDHCDKFNTLLEKAKTLWTQKKFEDAFAKLSAAREACPGRAAEVDTRYADFIRDIAGKYETADVKTREAKREAERALTATGLAERNATRSDSIADAAERAARRAYANDLAYKSTIALRDGDRTAAFRLAEFAHRYVDDDNPNVTNALVQAIYYNEDPTHEPLPWTENTFHGHSADIRSVSFSPDGKRIATGSWDNSAKIWDLESGKAVLTLEGHTGDVFSVAFSPDGEKLATASRDSTAKIWDLESGKDILTLTGQTSSIWTVAFSPACAEDPQGGKKLATGSADNTAKIWDFESGKDILTLIGHTDFILSVAFSPDGKKLATGSLDHTAKIWDLDSGKEILTLKGHTNDVLSVAFSSDGKTLATGSDDNTAKIWDLESGKDILTLTGHASNVESVAFLPFNSGDPRIGRILATGSDDKTVKFWDLKSGKDIMTLAGHTAYVWSVAFSPDGKKLVTGSKDKTAKIWDLEMNNDILTLLSSSNPNIAFSPDGKKLATGSDDNTAKIWDLESGENILTLKGHTYNVASIAFSPDGEKLATASRDSTAKIWDLESGKDILTLKGHTAGVFSVAFSPDGKKLASGSFDKTAKIWDLESGKDILTLKGHTSGVESVAFSPDGKRLATGSFDKTAKIWDLELGKDILTLKGHSAIVESVAFSPNGKKLATAGSYDNTAKIWDLESGKDILTLKGHINAVWSVAFSPDGKKIATGSYDKTAKIWDLESGKDILTLKGHTDYINSVAFSPDGKKLATAGSSGHTKIWDFTPQGWQASPVGNQLSNLFFSQLNAYNLSGLLDIYPENEKILCQSKDYRQIAAFAELYDQNTRNNRDLRSSVKDYVRAARLYRYALNGGGDSSMISSLGDLYLRWAEDILTANRPDTALQYMELSFRLCKNKSQYPKLWETYSEKINVPFDFNRFFVSEVAEELHVYGDYFFETGQWIKARQLYEKAEGKKHEPEIFVKLYKISEKMGEPFDFKRFLASEDAMELRTYGDFFFNDTLNWDKAWQLYKKAESKKHEPKIFVKLYKISEKMGEPFDFKRFLASEDAKELGSYATFFRREADEFEKFKDKIPGYQNSVLLQEKQMTFDTTAALRIEASSEYNSLGYYQLFLPNGKAAEASILRALELDPKNKYIHTNLAPALLLQSKYKEAEAEYKKWAPLPFNESNLATYRDAFLNDLKRMEAQGVPGFDFARVRGWLGE